MIKRTIEISTPGCYVHTKLGQLVIENNGQTLGSVPIEDIGLLIFDSHQLTISSSVMSSLSETNAAVIFTDDKHLPTSLTLPFSAHSIQTKVLEIQSQITQPVKKRLWATIVSAKILNQSRSLSLLDISANDLKTISSRVKSGDPQNLEAYAAKIYWKKLFGKNFRRDRDAVDHNVLLNYGYAVVRAATARAIVGTGLHPARGIHHKNQYNPFPLADDLVEPIRPFVDQQVVSLLTELADGEPVELDRTKKQKLLEVLSKDCNYDGRRLPLFTAIGYYTASVKNVIAGESKMPTIPML